MKAQAVQTRIRSSDAPGPVQQAFRARPKGARSCRVFISVSPGDRSGDLSGNRISGKVRYFSVHIYWINWIFGDEN